MIEEETNNQPSTPQGQVDEGLVDTEDYDKLSDEELEAKVKGTPAPVKPEPVTEPKEPAEPPKTVPAEELPDDLKGKTPEELAKAYLNIRKLHAKQDEELAPYASLRKKP